MAGRTRALSDLRADAYKRSDNENATDRHPAADVTRYVNQGAAELYDLLVEARGRAYYRASQTITTLANTTSYALDGVFYRLIAVHQDEPFGYGHALQSFNSVEEPLLRSKSMAMQYPTHYELRPGAIELLPLHAPGTKIVVDYVPVYPDLVADGDTFDGINGWEEYAVCFAARCMAVKDELWELASALERDMSRLKERIQKLAPTRDAFRPERVKDVRGGGLGRWPR